MVKVSCNSSAISITCNDGSAASGTYKSNKLGKGTGRGTDSDGKTVRLTFGLN
jgi:hypothetical protein